MADKYSCVCGIELTEVQVYRAYSGENKDIIILPGNRFAEVKCLCRRLQAVKARPTDSFHEAVMSLIDRMYQSIHIRGNDERQHRVKRMNKKCSRRLHKVVLAITDIFGHYFEYDVKEMFKTLSELADDQRKKKLSDVYNFILKEYDRKMKRNTALPQKIAA